MVYRADFKSVPARMVIKTFCAWCKVKEKIDGVWQDVLTSEYTTEASHGICTDCVKIQTKGRV